MPHPRVEGFLRRKEPKPDALPKVAQPFPLSAFDQLRMDYHDDETVALGTADWLGANDTPAWASSGFAVDQSINGLLGRHVRDYRYPNSQTLEAAWPAPQARLDLGPEPERRCPYMTGLRVGLHTDSSRRPDCGAPDDSDAPRPTSP